MLPVFTRIFAFLLRAAYFCIITRRALIADCDPMILLFTGLQDDIALDSLSALDREISLKNIHATMYMHDLSPFSIGCWIPPSCLRRSASI